MARGQDLGWYWVWRGPPCFEPGETWFYDYRSGEFFEGPDLTPPEAHPISQGVPGPKDKVPGDWQSKLHP